LQTDRVSSPSDPASAKIIQCQCGAQIRLPSQTENRAFRCPQCRNGIALTVTARVLESRRLGPGDPGATCPICQTAIAADEGIVACPQCDQIHHHECWSEVGGCGTYGCQEAPSLTKEEPATAPLSAWGDNKTCPACGETIKAIALRCRYCGTNFQTVDPLSLKDLHRQAQKKDTTAKLRQTAIALFVGSLLGLLAPLMLLLSLAMLLPKRRALAEAGPVYQVLGYGAIILSAMYTVLMVGFILFN
jgi:ssDNA-binding Zn-finger/Zn-ribbon topoisomerase 1